MKYETIGSIMFLSLLYASARLTGTPIWDTLKIVGIFAVVCGACLLIKRTDRQIDQRYRQTPYSKH